MSNDRTNTSPDGLYEGAPAWWWVTLGGGGGSGHRPSPKERRAVVVVRLTERSAFVRYDGRPEPWSVTRVRRRNVTPRDPDEGATRAFRLHTP
jgi:hypothetical protein